MPANVRRRRRNANRRLVHRLPPMMVHREPIRRRHREEAATALERRSALKQSALAKQVPPGRRLWRRRRDCLIESRRDATRARGESADGFGEKRDAVQVDAGERVFRGWAARCRLRFEAGALGGGAGHEGVIRGGGVFLLGGGSPVAAGDPGFGWGRGELRRGNG